jgi:hypothetical protein
MIIEMRTYTLQPGTVATFEERFAKALPVRAKVSPLAPSGTRKSAHSTA